MRELLDKDPILGNLLSIQMGTAQQKRGMAVHIDTFPVSPRWIPAVIAPMLVCASALLAIEPQALVPVEVQTGEESVVREQPGSLAVIVGPRATAPERLAAAELADYLRRLYPQTCFTVQSGLPQVGRAILVGSMRSDPKLRRYLSGEELKEPESYVVTTAEKDGRQLAVIVGADPEGTVYGVYAILRKLGCGFYLADPDTPEGYEYYKAQVAALQSAYPQIDCLVVWFRHGATPWMALRESEMPGPWQAQYRAELARTPDAAHLWRSHNFFALGKVVAAFDRALKELGREDVALAIGSWRFVR